MAAVGRASPGATSSGRRRQTAAEWAAAAPACMTTDAPGGAMGAAGGAMGAPGGGAAAAVASALNQHCYAAAAVAGPTPLADLATLFA